MPAHPLLRRMGNTRSTKRGQSAMQGSSSPAAVSADARVKRSGLLAIACVVLLAAGCGERQPCGAPRASSRFAARGLRRGTESVAALKVLGLQWSADPHQSDVLLLGY